MPLEGRTDLKPNIYVPNPTIEFQILNLMDALMYENLYFRDLE